MEEEGARAPLLQPRGEAADTKAGRARRAAAEWWVESKKLWRIVAPAIFQRIALFGINVVTQAFIGHLGDLELAAFSIAATVVAGFNFGFLVRCTHPHTHSSLPACSCRSNLTHRTHAWQHAVPLCSTFVPGGRGRQVP
jgi:hypothetical protein